MQEKKKGLIVRGMGHSYLLLEASKRRAMGQCEKRERERERERKTDRQADRNRERVCEYTPKCNPVAKI